MVLSRGSWPSRAAVGDSEHSVRSRTWTCQHPVRCTSKLLGGLGVRVVCPDYPPRLRRDQDIDFACMSKERKAVAAHLEKVGCAPDRRFNNLNGDRQMYFTAPSGRPIDVMVDKLTMCHTLDFRPSFRKLPYTVDVVDLLL